MSKKVNKNVTQMSKFEATMFACQRAKAKALKESGVKKISGPKPTKKRSLSESNKIARKIQNKKVENTLRRRRRMVEEDEYDPEVDDVDLPEDTVSDAVVVIDPELDTDEYEANLDDLQAIIDETPDGEVPSSDEYVNDFVYTCPICGNNFFSDTEMGSDEECPVCGEEVDEFILVGGVESPDEALGGSEDMEDIEDVDVDIDEDGSDEDIEVDADIEDEEEIDEDLDIDVEEEECDNESLSKDAKVKDCGDPIKKESYKYMLDEKTLNPFLTKFIKENYKNAVSMKAVRASISGRKMKVECVVKFKSGNTKKTTLTFENFIPTIKKRILNAKADSAFKVESRRVSPFKFEAYTKNNVIRFTGMKYDFVTKKEGKRIQVYGKYSLNEGKKSFRKGVRK